MSEEKSPKDNKHEENPYLNNPLHGVGLKTVLQELVSHYGFDILYAYLNINCFKSNPSLAASERFLKKTDWARQKVEVFYLYQYKNLPAVSSEQFKLPPRERIVPERHTPGEPAELSIEDGERLQDKRDKNAASRNSYSGGRKESSRYSSSESSKEYNEHRKAGGHYKFRGKSNGKYEVSSREDSKSKPSFYKSGGKSDDKSGSKSADKSTESNPTPPKDPWGNFKKGK